jgi:hypothetical protein
VFPACPERQRLFPPEHLGCPDFLGFLEIPGTLHLLHLVPPELLGFLAFLEGPACPERQRLLHPSHLDFLVYLGCLVFLEDPASPERQILVDLGCPEILEVLILLG